ncbi:inositol-3-phosphate synthase 1-B isoform 1 [Danaus plexippus plexippus]|uniref:Inositol-3-phosphate synthase n=1 Tax=Danaus plexippus plexippus TaxID=278856 RepID=A0A212FLK7_DANPL|nr:inositol-3-phosphate synthase 1-B isoform 1 [Danaus plexippus plexippus]
MTTTSNLTVSSPNIKYTDDYIFSQYEYQETLVDTVDNKLVAKPYSTSLSIRTDRRVGKVGVMLVGWGGNNGSTFTAAVIANREKLTWNTKDGEMDSNWYGSITQASTVRLGIDERGMDVYVAMSQLLPMVDPNDLVIDGWDISPMNLADAMVRAKVIDYDLQQKLRKKMQTMKPRPAIYDPDFIAANQADRALNLIRGTRHEQYLQIRADIKDFRDKNNLDKVIVLWTANTERFCEVTPGVHDTAENLQKALQQNVSEVSPSTIFAMAAVDEGQCKAHGSLIPECLKPVSIVSYNHLGNNDGKNLSAPKQFRSKEITKSNVVDDMVEANRLLYSEGEKPDHVVVIKYVPYVGDSKRAMDEYTSKILLHGTNTIAVHNTCEDSLLATPLILDLLLLAELFTRVSFRRDESEEWSPMHAVLSSLAYLLKAPLVPAGAPVVNALFKQRANIENLLRACLSLPPLHHLQLEHKVPFLMKELRSGAMFESPPKKQKLSHQNGDH